LNQFTLCYIKICLYYHVSFILLFEYESNNKYAKLLCSNSLLDIKDISNKVKKYILEEKDIALEKFSKIYSR